MGCTIMMTLFSNQACCIFLKLVNCTFVIHVDLGLWIEMVWKQYSHQNIQTT
jgi:hypothetical protein